VETKIRQWVGDRAPLMLLHGDVCRRELLLEIEGIAGASTEHGQGLAVNPRLMGQK